MLVSLAIALWLTAACEVEERVEADAPRSAPSAVVVTLHPTEPGPRHREVLPEWDIGVGFVRIPPTPDGPPGTAAADTFPILAEPQTGAPLVARAFHREWQLEIEAARPGLVSGALEVGYEETALPVLETGVGPWLRVSYAFDSDGTAVTGWVDATDSAAETVTWASWLANGAFFFIDADSIGFYEEPEGPVLTLALEPGQGTQRFDYTLYDIRTQGAWMEVRVASPSDYCVDATSDGSDVATGTNAWIRFLDEEGRPRIWYHTRGC